MNKWVLSLYKFAPRLTLVYKNTVSDSSYVTVSNELEIKNRDYVALLKLYIEKWSNLN